MAVVTDNFINADMVKVARQARGLSQTQLAALADITQAAVSKVEGGLMQLSPDAVERIATALDFPVSLFFQTDRVFGLPVSLNYRKKASVGQRSIEQLEAQVNIRLMHLRRLLASVDHHPELQMPDLDVDEFGGDGGKVAEIVRRLWLVPSGPIRNLVELAERAGCVVFSCDFESIGVDGLTLQSRGLPVCIFLNAAMPGDRQRFTLAHELGHAIMHKLPTSEMEKQADQFAAALLMPRAEISPQFSGGVTLPRLASLKLIWRVSMGALLVRAKTIGAINESQSSYLWRQMSKAGYRTREPQELSFDAERPTVVSDTIRAHTDALGYSLDDLAKMLHMHQDQLVEMHGLALPDRPKLRLVR